MSETIKTPISTNTEGGGEEKPNIEALRKQTSNFITRSKSFNKLCKYVFSICDGNHTGAINATELYAGVLLVHLNLAKYAGAAACYPATRQAVDQLFLASDDDNSGGVDEAEFMNIMIITAASISSRILTYYAFLIVLVPYLAARIINILEFLRVDDGILKIDAAWDATVPDWLNWFIDIVPDSFWLSLPEQIISLAFFFFVIPKIFDKIDQTGAEVAERTVVTNTSSKSD
mmetsp:Transcript_31933/g.52698  ORF Transcript_31933/g.52698 Transcript_31933/m.52698 type:complete len:231 (-) Transcript_31933:933-1625(-)|eukprot:CAMPEP_0119003454 /NCGR_PEP_ID=MMETSP1176-20130426/569_1 /TAXON_ID=265551 /ORGANISM="Synedropsis recta cf, Strain CCMP1620" /LENGTH=230 /DNA_ID=CAMNT_0006955059 /DNA_START=69 /DNA_END=761 /DNA_ORIENTATION=+